MKKFFSVLLSIIFAICLFATILLGVARANLSTSKITELAGQFLKISKAPVIQFEDDGLFHPEQKVITYAQFNPEDFGDFDISSLDLSNMDINEIVQSYLEEYEIDVDPEVVAEILASPEITQTVSQYADEIINYMTGASDELNIDPAQITKVVNTAIDKYEAATGEVVDRTGLDEAISENVEAMVPELTATLDSAKEENAEAFDILRKVNFWLSLKIFILAICICVVLALVIFLIHMNIIVCFKFISIPAIVDGLIIFIAALVARGIAPAVLSQSINEYGLPAAVFEIAMSFIKTIVFQLKICGIVSTILGVILCVLGFKLGKSKPAEIAAPTQE
ncbi:MAG: hypothetical protein IK024_09195 [Treponema sp.]|nr:hypothetical protein [Treponema sp.]